jgi:hypothetical protein
MKILAAVQQLNGIVTVTMEAQFIGDSTDATDQQRIAAYGDPQVNLSGMFTDPTNTAFTFSFPATQLFVGITTQMSSFPARFMTALPPGTLPWNPNPVQGQLDCLTTNPVRAATVWAAAMDTAIATALTTLRALTPAALTSLPSVDV